MYDNTNSNVKKAFKQIPISKAIQVRFYIDQSALRKIDHKALEKVANILNGIPAITMLDMIGDEELEQMRLEQERKAS